MGARPVGDVITRAMLAEHAKGRGIPWGNLNYYGDPNPALVNRIGLEAALYRASSNVSSPHRASSGQTSELASVGATRKERNTIRRAHYQRKGELEGHKQARRLEHWERYHGHRGNQNWIRREDARKTRRAGVLAARKAAKAARKTHKA